MTIQTLVEKKSSFIFATHMHHLPSIPEIAQMPSNQLRICHLTAVFDDQLGELTYSRKLADGPGSSIYGLEVCKSLAIDREFIEKANTIRRTLADIPPLLLTEKKSRYNTLVRVDNCSICGTNINLHGHHIQEQHKADEDGFIDHFHKNREFNILVLCQKCHNGLHSNGTQLIPKQSLSGVYYEVIE